MTNPCHRLHAEGKREWAQLSMVVYTVIPELGGGVEQKDQEFRFIKVIFFGCIASLNLA